MRYAWQRNVAPAILLVCLASVQAQFPWIGANAPWRVDDPQCLYNDTLNDFFYVAGTNSYPGDSFYNINTLYRLQDQQWDTLGRFGGDIQCVINWHDTLLVAGGFVSINGMPIQNIVGYANGSWFPYGLVNQVCTKLRILNGDL